MPDPPLGALHDLLDLVLARDWCDREIEVQIACLLPMWDAHIHSRPGSKPGLVVSTYENGRTGTWNCPNFLTSLNDAAKLVHAYGADPDLVLRLALDDFVDARSGDDAERWTTRLPAYVVGALLKALIAKQELDADHAAGPGGAP